MVFMNIWRRGVLTSSLPDSIFKQAKFKTRTKKTKNACCKTIMTASIIHILLGILNKRWNKELVQTWEGSDGCLHNLTPPPSSDLAAFQSSVSEKHLFHQLHRSSEYESALEVVAFPEHTHKHAASTALSFSLCPKHSPLLFAFFYIPVLLCWLPSFALLGVKLQVRPADLQTCSLSCVCLMWYNQASRGDLIFIWPAFDF